MTIFLKKCNRISLLLFTIVLMQALHVNTTLALSPVYTPFFNNLSLKGYDVVTYFSENKPRKGSAQYEYKWKDANWHFVSQENLEKFKQNPEKYAPQYGGYCAWAVARNYTASGDPLQWTIVDNKLYINYSASIKKKWLADKPRFIKQADNNWPNLLQK